MEINKINLDDILSYNEIDKEGETGEYSRETVIDCMKQAIKEALELAAEEVKLTDFATEFLQEGASNAINKLTILDIIFRVE